MPHLAAMAWDHADRLQHCDLGGGGDVWSVYDAAGNRVRKVQVNTSGSTVRERVYVGAWEVWRERTGTPLAVEQERQTLHVGDDRGKLALVETLTVDNGDPVGTPTSILRHQHGNHLGSASLELNENAAVISYEEFHPFGTSSYAANDSGIEVSAKRYRYIGKERDEETGLYHLGARYYSSWLGRWTAADPIGLGDGVNRYDYASGRPVLLSDPGGQKGETREQLRSRIQGEVNRAVEQGTIKEDDARGELTRRLTNALGDQTPEKRKPKREGNEPYSSDKRGEVNLERARKGHQDRLGAQYDANKKVADEVRARDGGAAGVVAEVGFGFTFAGLVLDARALDQALDDYGAGKVGLAVVGIAALGFFPLLGDAAKHAGRQLNIGVFARGVGVAPGTSVSNNLPGGGGGGGGGVADNAADAAQAAAKTRLAGLQSSFGDLAERHLLPQFRALDPNLKAGYTGSFRTGVVGNPNKIVGATIDLNDFDIDYWIESDVLFGKFGPNLKANPEFRKLLAETPGFEGLRPNKSGFSIRFKPSGG